MHETFNELCRQASSRGLHVELRSTNRAKNAITQDGGPAPTVDAVRVAAKNGHVMASRPTDLAGLEVVSERLLRQMGWKAKAA